jgi:hypothetical protein
MSHIRIFATIGLILTIPATSSAQTWKEIGKTRDSTAIFVKPASIARAGDTVTVLVLARYVRANFVSEGKDTVRAVTVNATFVCGKEKVKTIETVRFSNFDRNRVVSRSKPKIPAYQAVFGGSMPQVYAHVCPKKK